MTRISIVFIFILLSYLIIDCIHSMFFYKQKNIGLLSRKTNKFNNKTFNNYFQNGVYYSSIKNQINVGLGVTIMVGYFIVYLLTNIYGWMGENKAINISFNVLSVLLLVVWALFYRDGFIKYSKFKKQLSNTNFDVDAYKKFLSILLSMNINSTRLNNKINKILSSKEISKEFYAESSLSLLSTIIFLENTNKHRRKTKIDFNEQFVNTINSFYIF